MELLSFDALQELAVTRTKRITVPELGGDIFIKRPQAKDQVKFDEVFGLFGSHVLGNGGEVYVQTNPLRLAACKVACCVIDPSQENRPVFTSDSVYCLTDDQIYAVSKQIDAFAGENVLSQDDVAKN
ncbi:hypothetical protein LVJ82_00570 [Vitreoscilla massiliensis]|uniref:Uncharacterized protein n=1 Tax=Vitreoscilla massiliensis TaxID=1689272 RepID=A0ABY4E5A6_9NEIS|nr:hypothetical protein [Vitreoscilla massiliensis]UOO89508.1 hypothetical protein LVJ82_00570 [Vitreoscilla massiliensis]